MQNYLLLISVVNVTSRAVNLLEDFPQENYLGAYVPCCYVCFNACIRFISHLKVINMRYKADCKGEVLLLLPATQIEACASLSRSRPHRPVSSCVRPVKTRLWQFSLGRSAQVNDRASTTRTKRSYVRLIFNWTSSAWPCDPRPCVNCTGCRYTSASNMNCAPWCTWFIMECCRCTSPTQSSSSPTARHDLVCVLPTTRCTGYTEMYTSILERAFPYSGLLASNALPSTLRDIADRTRFRKLLKTHFFDRILAKYLFVMHACAWTYM